MPEVTFKLHQKAFYLSWLRPFTWEEYDITAYHAQCRNNKTAVAQSETITDNSTSLAVTLSLLDVTECTTVQCNVTASNVLATSAPAVTSIFIPRPIPCENDAIIYSTPNAKKRARPYNIHVYKVACTYLFVFSSEYVYFQQSSNSSKNNRGCRVKVLCRQE